MQVQLIPVPRPCRLCGAGENPDTLRAMIVYLEKACRMIRACNCGTADPFAAHLHVGRMSRRPGKSCDGVCGSATCEKGAEG